MLEDEEALKLEVPKDTVVGCFAIAKITQSTNQVEKTKECLKPTRAWKGFALFWQ